MPKYFRDEDVAEANKIMAGDAPIQATAGRMTPAERIASVGRAFGAKAPAKKADPMEAEAAALQELLGKDVKVSPMGKKAGGKVKKYKSGGMASASKRADGCAVRGKTKGRML